MWYKFEKDLVSCYGCIVEADSLEEAKKKAKHAYWEKYENESFCGRYMCMKFDAEAYADERCCGVDDITTEDVIEDGIGYFCEYLPEDDDLFNEFKHNIIVNPHPWW